MRRAGVERDFFFDDLLVRIHLIIEMIWWTGLALQESEFPFPGALRLPSYEQVYVIGGDGTHQGANLISKAAAR